MGEAALVEGSIDAGARLLAELDDSGFPVSAALWFYLADVDRWSLFIASPRVDVLGQRAAYFELRERLSEDAAVPLRDIALVGDHERLIELFRSAISVDDSAVRFTDNVINGVLIQDAVIYRVQAAFDSRESTPPQDAEDR